MPLTVSVAVTATENLAASGLVTVGLGETWLGYVCIPLRLAFAKKGGTQVHNYSFQILTVKFGEGARTRFELHLEFIFTGKLQFSF